MLQKTPTEPKDSVRKYTGEKSLGTSTVPHTAQGVLGFYLGAKLMAVTGKTGENNCLL